ncbi:hypothetical protein KI387_034715 [Taxus chinensis]|uniref:Uncharacterized protein n=1 Tax=Taxus chinensis TaxID=29808 RepID=A0AA38C5Z7_TAXCH|nr:hypothetical protein KI387_034715 [Taxus chinensis]
MLSEGGNGRSTIERGAGAFEIDYKNVRKEDGSYSLNACFNREIRPLLDAVDKLRNLGAVKEGIHLPTIVVVGDQSSGKSSVLESLSGIDLPRGQGICTRVPLIMRLQNSTEEYSVISVEYKDRKLSINEHQIVDTINLVTEEIAGRNKGISDDPITLHVRKKNVPDLTLVDLPGITRVPVYGQPKDIYEQVYKIIMKYISPRDSIILNVLSATVDFPTCESIRMSQKVDEDGERTLAVVTKVDKAPEGLREKVAEDAMNIGLGYVCVRNRVEGESIVKARKKENELFKTHPLLSGIDKSIVGIPILAHKLMKIQAAGITNSLPRIMKEIDTKLARRQAELNDLPENLCNPADAMILLTTVMGSIKDSLNGLLLQGDYQEFSEDGGMHCAARLNEMFMGYYRDLCASATDMNDVNGQNFLLKEITMLKEAQGVGLPNFLSRQVFLNLVQQRANGVAEISLRVVEKVWDYLDGVMLRVIDRECQTYPQLNAATKRAAGHLLIRRNKEDCIEYVKDMIETEKCVDFTVNPLYMDTYTKLHDQKDRFLYALRNKKKTFSIDGFGEVKLENIKEDDQLQAAFDMKMSVVAYWKVVIFRLADGIPLHLRFVYRKMVRKEIGGDLMKEIAGSNLDMIEKIFQESPAVASKRRSLIDSLALLRDAKLVVYNIIDKNNA